MVQPLPNSQRYVPRLPRQPQPSPAIVEDVDGSAARLNCRPKVSPFSEAAQEAAPAEWARGRRRSCRHVVYEDTDSDDSLGDWIADSKSDNDQGSLEVGSAEDGESNGQDDVGPIQRSWSLCMRDSLNIYHVV